MHGDECVPSRSPAAPATKRMPFGHRRDPGSESNARQNWSSLHSKSSRSGDGPTGLFLRQAAGYGAGNYACFRKNFAWGLGRGRSSLPGLDARWLCGEMPMIGAQRRCLGPGLTRLACRQFGRPGQNTPQKNSIWKEAGVQPPHNASRTNAG